MNLVMLRRYQRQAGLVVLHSLELELQNIKFEHWNLCQVFKVLKFRSILLPYLENHED